jgi:hypothetical protein
MRMFAAVHKIPPLREPCGHGAGLGKGSDPGLMDATRKLRAEAQASPSVVLKGKDRALTACYSYFVGLPRLERGR